MPDRLSNDSDDPIDFVKMEALVELCATFLLDAMLQIEGAVMVRDYVELAAKADKRFGTVMRWTIVRKLREIGLDQSQAAKAVGIAWPIALCVVCDSGHDTRHSLREAMA